MTSPSASTPAYESSVHGARVVLMAGLPGAGKTTLARELVGVGFKRLCPDEEMFRRYGHYGRDFPRGQFRIREAPVLEDISKELQELVAAGHDVVVDHGFWTPEERSLWAAITRDAGGTPLLVYLPVSHEVRWSRIKERNAKALVDANAIEFSEEDLRRFEGRFIPPTAHEPHTVYTSEHGPIFDALTQDHGRPVSRPTEPARRS